MKLLLFSRTDQGTQRMAVAQELLTQVLSLPTSERVEITERLIESLPAEDLPIMPDDELTREIARRIEQRRLGNAKTVDFETFKRNIREAAKGPQS